MLVEKSITAGVVKTAVNTTRMSVKERQSAWKRRSCTHPFDLTLKLVEMCSIWGIGLRKSDDCIS